MKKLFKYLLTVISGVSITASGCVYSHNYDKNGQEMDEEQVKDVAEDIKESAEMQIDSAIEGQPVDE